MTRRELLTALCASPIIPLASPQNEKRNQSREKPSPKPANPEEERGIYRRVLPSGLRLIVVERPDAPLVALDLRVRVGSGDELPEFAGHAHVLEHLVFKGTEHAEPGALDLAIESFGGEVSARTYRDFTEYTTTISAVHWRETLALLSQMLLQPALRAADLAAEKRVIGGELALAQLDPLRTAITTLSATLHQPTDPYARPIFATPKAVTGVSIESLRSFQEDWYRPPRMTLTVVGPVRAADVYQEAARAFSGKKSQPAVRPTRIAQVVLPKESGYHATSISLRGQLTTTALGWTTPPAADATTHAALAVLSEALTQGEQGRLDSVLVGKKRRLVRVTADSLPQRAGGLFVITATAERRSAEQVEGWVLDELRRIAEDGFSDEELESARHAAQSRIAAEEATVEGTARRVAFYDALDVPGGEEELRRALSVVRADELTLLLQRVLHPDRRGVVTIGGDA